MACNITLDSITVPGSDDAGNPIALQIQASITGTCQQVFMQIDGGVGVLANVTNNSFSATLLLGEHYQPGDIRCDIENEAEIVIQCLSGDSCQFAQRVGLLDCPSCTLDFAPSPVEGIPGTITDTPTQVTIRGTVSSCEALEVRFTYSTSDPGKTEWREATIVGGSWEASFHYTPAADGIEDYSKEVVCGQDIIVEARCKDDDDCIISGTFPLNCQPAQDCPGSSLTAVIDKECRSNRRLVIFTVTLTEVTAETEVSGYIATDDSSIGVEGQLPVQYSPETSGDWSANGSSSQRTYEYTYPPGTYTPTLVLEGACAGSTPLSAITDLAGNPISSLEIEQCDCAEATIAVTVCRVLNRDLTCSDEIPESDCQALSEEELASPLPPGVYVAKAETDPEDAGPISWSQEGNPITGASGSTYCFSLENGETLEIIASVNLGANCGVPSDSVTLIGEPGEDEEQPPDEQPPPDEGTPPDENDEDEDDDDDDEEENGNDGCLLDWCRVWLLINIGLAFFGGAAIIITACLLFNPATITWAFWVGVGISVVLVLASIISFIIWGFVCGRFRRLCGLLVWVHDVFLLLSAASGIIGLILLVFGQPPCAIGFFLDFAYFGVMAAIAEAILRFSGCPLGQNGIIGVLIAVFEWLTNALGLNSGS